MCRNALAILVLALPAAALADPEPEPPPADEAVAKEAEPEDVGFGFGSYGRVGVGTDLRGSTPEPVNVVAHGSRVVERPYMELDMYYRMPVKNDVRVTTVATVAFADELFHSSGEFDATIALRNLYAEAVTGSGWSVWIGSRMYRGDDIYLLDYWPLDDVNTVGGGVGLTRGKLELGFHAGANRLDSGFQYQEFDVPDPEFGAETITQLDRQRFIATGKLAYRVLPRAKVKVYGEFAALPAGELRKFDDETEALPEDFGWSLGAQLGTWGFGDRGTHANVFARFSQGLTAYDELATPFGFDPTRKTFPGAAEVVLGTSVNYERGPAGVMAGGYLRRFVDADGNDDRDDRWEWIADVRPSYAVNGSMLAAVDVSYQRAYPRGISPTMLLATEPAVFQIAPMFVYAPFGAGSYERPQFRVLYRAAHLNDGARDLYPMEDARRSIPWVHFLGMQVEWWFNSTYR